MAPKTIVAWRSWAYTGILLILYGSSSSHSSTLSEVGSMAREYLYVAVWIGLVIFTLLEVLVLGLELGTLLMVLLVLGLASVKAVLVALFYQHLRYEPPSLGWFYVASVLIILAIIVTWITGV